MDQTIIIPDLWVPIVAGPLIVILTGLFSAAQAGDNVRQVIAIVLAGVTAVVEQLASAEEFTVEGLLATFVLALGSQLVAYLSTKRIIDVNSRVVPNFGIKALPGGSSG